MHVIEYRLQTTKQKITTQSGLLRGKYSTSLARTCGSTQQVIITIVPTADKEITSAVLVLRATVLLLGRNYS